MSQMQIANVMLALAAEGLAHANQKNDAKQARIAELEHEVMCLRAELAAGAARQGGDTSAKGLLDGLPKYEWWLIDRGNDDEYVRVKDVEARLAATTASDKAQHKEKA